MSEKQTEIMCPIRGGQCYGDSCMFTSPVEDGNCLIAEALEHFRLACHDLSSAVHNEVIHVDLASVAVTDEGEILTYDNSRFAR